MANHKRLILIAILGLVTVLLTEAVFAVIGQGDRTAFLLLFQVIGSGVAIAAGGALLYDLIRSGN